MILIRALAWFLGYLAGGYACLVLVYVGMAVVPDIFGSFRVVGSTLASATAGGVGGALAALIAVPIQVLLTPPN
jgi:hypothetical protein